MALSVPPFTDEERTTLARVAHSRTAATRDVERARIIWLASQGQRVPAIAVELHLSATTVRRWLKRFNAGGLAGLTDAFRSGRPATYTPGQVAEVIATALSDPQQLQLLWGALRYRTPRGGRRRPRQHRRPAPPRSRGPALRGPAHATPGSLDSGTGGSGSHLSASRRGPPP